MVTDCIKSYHKNGVLYSELYFLDSKWHREDGPAAIFYYPNGMIDIKQYWLEGKHHREDGPSSIYYDENGSVISEFYHLYGEQYSDKDIIDNWEMFCKMQIFR
jgi:hypothetical protein